MRTRPPPHARLPLLLFAAAALALVALAPGCAAAPDKLALLEGKQRASGGGAFAITSADYELLTAKPRDYALVVVFTAMAPQFKCQLCRDFEPELRLVAQSWAAQRAPEKLYFAVLDFMDGQQIFGNLNIRNAPIVYHFPPTVGAGAKTEPDTYDVPRKGKDAEDFAAWLESTAKIKVPIRRPPNYSAILSGLVLVGALVVAGKIVSDNFLWVLRSRYLWMGAGLIFIIMMISATMWNTIRGAEYAGRGRGGAPEIFAPGFGTQYVVETQVVGFLYALISLSLVGLIHAREVGGPGPRSWAPYVLLAAFMFLLSWLFAVFRKKNGGYPFRLLL